MILKSFALFVFFAIAPAGGQELLSGSVLGWGLDPGKSQHGDFFDLVGNLDSVDSRLVFGPSSGTYVAWLSDFLSAGTVVVSASEHRTAFFGGHFYLYQDQNLDGLLMPSSPPGAMHGALSEEVLYLGGPTTFIIRYDPTSKSGTIEGHVRFKFGEGFDALSDKIVESGLYLRGTFSTDSRAVPDGYCLSSSFSLVPRNK